MSNCKHQSRAESFLQIKSRRKEQHSKLAVNKLNRAKLLDFLVPLLARENRYLSSSGWKLQQQTKLIQASPVFFGVPKQRPETACSFVASPMTGYKDKKRSLIGQVSTDEFGANWFLKMKPRLWLAYFMKGMLFGCEQPFLWGERCVTSQKTAAEEHVLTLQNFANSGVLFPDFETFIVAAETYVLFRLLNILWGQFYFHHTNSQLYSKILC